MGIRSRLLPAGLALTLLGPAAPAEEIYYAFRSGATFGVAEIQVDRPKKRIVAERVLWESPDGARPLALRVASDPPRLVVVLAKPNSDNVVIIGLANAPERSWSSVRHQPRAIALVGPRIFVASDTEITALEREPQIPIYPLVEGRTLAALAGVASRRALLAASSGADGSGRVEVLSVEVLTPAVAIDLGRTLAHPDLVAVEPGGARALVASHQGGVVAVLDLEAKSVSARFDAEVEGFSRLCLARKDGGRIEAFPASGSEGVAIDLAQAAVIARFESAPGLAASFYLDAPGLALAAGGAEAKLSLVSLSEKNGRAKLAAVTLPSVPGAVAPVQRETCIQVVAAGLDAEQQPTLFLIDVVARRRNHTRPALGEVLLMATPFDR